MGSPGLLEGRVGMGSPAATAFAFAFAFVFAWGRPAGQPAGQGAPVSFYEGSQFLFEGSGFCQNRLQFFRKAKASFFVTRYCTPVSSCRGGGVPYHSKPLTTTITRHIPRHRVV